MNRIVTTFFMVACFSTSNPTAVRAQSFSGDFEFAWLDTPDGQHRDMLVLKQVVFTDALGKRWTVPPKSKIDGASIPRLLWTFAGSPFVGKYRRASVIHDHFCDIRTELQSKVHLMFKEAMLADGASWWEANSKYAAVEFAGLCPEKVGVTTSKLDLFVENNPLRFNDSALSQLNAPKRDDETSAQKFERNKEMVQSKFDPNERRVFNSLLALKGAETQENLESLERTLQNSGLDDQRYEALVMLVENIYPEDFK
ncbi:MAG: DUF1353 domain-containing protein [Hoeflea sp.]|uniref:DUF1353 domain-containing protein n=1 Tax=Hoeflea sp. TaxID=1940281 RepID=UPI00273193D4|nr:DUF1353 domain-containing protein [Hoeflea sp.]MDP2122051.1 DUF1353 domain-containing protein [Hoeflea sp.]